MTHAILACTLYARYAWPFVKSTGIIVMQCEAGNKFIYQTIYDQAKG